MKNSKERSSKRLVVNLPNLKMFSLSNDASSEDKNYELITVNQFANKTESKEQVTTAIATGNWSKDCSLSGGAGMKDAELQHNNPSTARDGFVQKFQGKSDREKEKSLHSAGSAGGKESTTKNRYV